MNDLCYMRTSLLTLTFLLTGFLALGQNARQNYIDQYAKLAVSEMRRTGVPASITLAQGILESGNGLSKLAKEGNNHFGIKCHEQWEGKTMYMDDDVQDECFRVYSNPRRSFKDHSNFLATRSRYYDLFLLDPTDYIGWAKGLKAAGYATNPAYAERLIKIIEDEQLYLYDQKVYPEAKRGIATHSRYVRHPFAKGYFVLEEGERIEDVALIYNVSLVKLLEWNDRQMNDVWSAGDRVYTGIKVLRAPKRLKFYRAQAGESTWDIAQKFGIQLKALYKINDWAAGYQPSAGELVKLR